MKKCLVVGAGGHCRALLSILQEQGDAYDIVGIVDLQPLRGKETILGVEVVGTIADLPRFKESGVTALFLALGDNAERARHYHLAKELGFELPNLIAPGAYLAASATIGDANLICHRCHLGPVSRIGNGNILNTGSVLEHESTVDDFCHLAPLSVISGRSHLGSQVFLGVNGTVIDKVKVCDRVIIGAGSVVVKDITGEDATYVGVPARSLAAAGGPKQH